MIDVSSFNFRAIFYNSYDEFSQIKRFCWIASGLAKISASYACSLCELNSKVTSDFYTPLKYKINKNKSEFDMPILVTLGGKGSDALDIANLIYDDEDVMGLVTANIDSSIIPLFMKKDSFLCIGEYPKQDKRFVNINGIVCLSHLCEKFVSVIYSSVNVFDLELLDYRDIMLKSKHISNCIINVKNWQEKIIILGVGYNSFYEHTWRSILQESGVSSIRWQDIKDFTHGEHQYIGLCKEKYIFLILETDDVTEYAEMFECRFENISQVHRIKLSNSIQRSFWENLYYVIYLSNELSIHLGFYGKRPPKNELVDSWRNWGRL